MTVEYLTTQMQMIQTEMVGMLQEKDLELSALRTRVDEQEKQIVFLKVRTEWPELDMVFSIPTNNSIGRHSSININSSSMVLPRHCSSLQQLLTYPYPT